MVDLFSGMGGMSLGFAQSGFDVHGYDAEHHAVAAYAANVGPATQMDLRSELPDERPAVIVGGPPCRPWSPMNLQRRRSSHGDYDLVDRFREAVDVMNPCAFVLENVPFLRNDREYRNLIDGVRGRYEITEDIYSYAHWGAATRRRRLFAIGIERGHPTGLDAVADGLARRRTTQRTVGEAFRLLPLEVSDPTFDHDWPDFKTIGRYASKYEVNKYGWYRLDETLPAPSFGNVMKTYTLRRGSEGFKDRAVSPREVLSLLGFASAYRFPPSVPRTAKYRMAADAVSPVFSAVVADVVAEVLGFRSRTDRP